MNIRLLIFIKEMSLYVLLYFYSVRNLFIGREIFFIYVYNFSSYDYFIAKIYFYNSYIYYKKYIFMNSEIYLLYFLY